MAKHNDIAAATQTYGGFLSLLKWGVIAAFFVTAIVILLIAT